MTPKTSGPVRVRFAPSPTGGLHIGGVRTALYNYLFARHHGGEMILRIEDTDQTRLVEGAEQYIMDALRWVGISWSEGPDVGGPHGPYRQSERKSLYKQYADQLVESGHAYYAFDTPEELDAMRERLKAARVASPQYNSITRETMKNSLTLPASEVEQRLSSGEPYVIRLKVPRKEEVRLNDMVRGWVMVHSSAIDDKVLMKADGMPTYHLANIVDDHLMGITHVIRGEEWLPSAPLHVLLYKFLGWEQPQFAHLPLILKPDGNGKLSKRDADKAGFPLFPLTWKDPNTGDESLGFKQVGYLPEALVNFLAFLGWSPGDNREVFTMEELVQEFRIDRVGKAGTKFDILKAHWYNELYLRQKPAEELVAYLQQGLEAAGIAHSYGPEKLASIAKLLAERATFPGDMLDQGRFFFAPPVDYDDKAVRKKWNPEVAAAVSAWAERLEGLTDESPQGMKSHIVALLDELGLGLGKFMPGLRLAVTGEGSGPDLMEVLSILGTNEVKHRLLSSVSILSERTE